MSIGGSMSRFDKVLREVSFVRVILMLICVAALVSYKYLYLRARLSWLSGLIWSLVFMYLMYELNRVVIRYYRKRRQKGVDLADTDSSM
jgi:hypothetical protein